MNTAKIASTIQALNFTYRAAQIKCKHIYKKEFSVNEKGKVLLCLDCDELVGVFHPENDLSHARYKMEASIELKNLGFTFGWLELTRSNTKMNQYEFVTEGKYFKYYRKIKGFNRIVKINGSYYYLQGE